MLDQLADEAGLSAHAREKLAKARRVLDAMQATLLFFWTMIAVRLETWKLSQPVQRWMREDLFPAYYLRRSAEKADTAEQRQRLRELSEGFSRGPILPTGSGGRSVPRCEPSWSARPGTAPTCFSGAALVWRDATANYR